MSVGNNLPIWNPPNKSNRISHLMFGNQNAAWRVVSWTQYEECISSNLWRAFDQQETCWKKLRYLTNWTDHTRRNQRGILVQTIVRRAEYCGTIHDGAQKIKGRPAIMIEQSWNLIAAKGLIKEGPYLRTKENRSIYPRSNHVILHHNILRTYRWVLWKHFVSLT